MTVQRIKASVFAAVAGAVTLATLSELTHAMGLPLLIASFGPSATVMLAYPDSKFCRPQNVLGAYLVAAFTALVMLHVFGDSCVSLAVSLAVSIFALLAVRLMHPPAIALPIIVFAIKPDWTFLIFPVASGAITLLLVARVGLYWFCKWQVVPREHQNTDSPQLGSLGAPAVNNPPYTADEELRTCNVVMTK